MAETLRELVVRLSLESGNFSRNMRTIAQQVKEAESVFNLAGAGVKDFGTTLQGAQSKLTMLKSKLDLQKSAVDQYSRALQAAEEKLKANKTIHDDFADRLEKAKSKQTQLKESVDRAREAYEYYKTTLGETNHITVEAKESLDAAEKEFKDNEAAVKQLDGQVVAINKTLQNNADQVSKLQTGLNNAKAAVKDTEAQIKSTEQEVRKLSSAFTQAGTALTKFSKGAKDISKSLTTAGKTLTKSITTPVVALGTGAVKAAMDFESAMAGVHKTLPKDAEEFMSEADAVALLGKRIEQLSLETASSAEDIAKVVETAGQLGIEFGKNGDTIMDFAKTMVMLGDATDMSAESAADSAARFFNIMGKRGSEAQYSNYGAAVTELGNRFATTESEIVEMSMRLAGAGKQVGLSEQQILGFATALSSVGIKAQMGGSAFSKALVNMEVAVETGNKQLKSFAEISGMTAEQFKATWKADPGQAFQNFIIGLSRYAEDEGNSAIAFLQDMGFKEIRLRDTTLRLTNATELMKNAQRSANEAWAGADIKGQNALVNEANKRYQTMASKLTQLKNKAAIFARTVGRDLTPTLQKVMEAASNLIDKFLGMDEGTRQMIERFAMVAAAVGPVVLVLGKLIGVVGSVAGGAGKIALALGKISAAAQGVSAASGSVTGVLGALASGGTLAAAGVGAVGVAAAVGVGALIDYATGAKKARKAVEGLGETAKEWAENTPQTIYSAGGNKAFGMDTSAYTNSRTSMQKWKDQVVEIWNDGEKDTKETVTKWTGDFKELTNGTREELKELKSQARLAGDGALTKSLSKDLRTLDNIDKEVAYLLNRSRSRKLTDKEKVKLENLIQQGDAIRIKYKLEPQTDGNDGYEELQAQLEARVARLQAAGAGEKEITEAYGQAAHAAGQGYAAIKKQLDENYEAEYRNIKQTKTGAEQSKALAELDKQYQSQRTKATQEYADVLKGYVTPVLEKMKTSGVQEQVTELYGQLAEYQKLKESGDNQGAANMLEKIQESAAGLDQSQLTEFYTVLTQIQGLADEGVDVSALFPEENLSGPMTELASISQYLTQVKDELPGLNSMINDTLANDIREVTIDLNMTKAEERWANFAADPGKIMTDAVIKAYEDEEAAKALAPVCEAAVSAYVESPEGATKPTPEGLKAYVNSYLEQAGVDKTKLKPENIQAIVSSYAEKAGLSNDPEAMKALEPFVTAWIEEYADKPGTEKPTEIPMKVRLNRLDQAELAKFTALNKVTLKANVVRAGTEFGSVQDLFKSAEEGGNIHFYKDGVEIPVSVAKAEGSVSLNSLLGVDENGEFHVVIVPEYGSEELIQETRELLQGDSQQTGKGPLAFLFNSDTLSMMQKAAQAVRSVNDSTDPKSIERLEGLQGSLQQLTNLSPDSVSNLADYVANVVAAIQNGQTISAEDYQNLTDILTVLQGIGESGAGQEILNEVAAGVSDATGMENVGAALAEKIQESLTGANVQEASTTLGDDVAAGAGQGMETHDFSSSAETTASNIDTALRGAENSHSPAQRTVPIGSDIAAGVGEGMVGYSWAEAANAVAANIDTAFMGIVNSGRFNNAGTQAMTGVGNGMRSYNWVSTMRSVASKMLSALQSSVKISDYEAIGKNMMSGIAKGINNGKSGVVDAMVSAVKAAIAAAKEEADINSPSRVFRDEVGVMFMKGMTAGVEKETPNTAAILANATRYLAEVAHGAVTTNNVSNDNRRSYDNSQSFNVTQNIYANETDYATQQRLAAQNLMDIARRI